ncbi:MAG: Ig-like domain-containing protein [Gemmatimonadaceae bacterium]|nr:Ig-like domain-containing protein [Gemmatimonadaceae bacterium]
MSQSNERMSSFWKRLGLSFTVAMLVAACSSGDAGTAPPPAPVVARVEIEPATLTLVEGQSLTVTAIPLDASGTEILGKAIAWSSTDSSVAYVDASGQLIAVGVGTAEIWAEAGGIAGTAAVTVTAAPVVSIALSASVLSLSKSTSQAITAVLTDALGREVQGRAVAWSSNNPAVATVSNAGVVAAIDVGYATITASIDGQTASLAVTVRRAAVASVDVSPGAMVLEIGETRQMTAVLKDAQGNVLEDRVVQWSVDNGNAAISPYGLLIPGRAGYVTVRATSEGVVGAVAATIVAADAYAYDLAYNRVSNNGDAELFILTLGDGADPQRINAGNVSRDPTASPDGRRLAFAVSMSTLPTGEWQENIYAVDRTGLHMRQLTTAEGAEDQPAWSPVGGRIAYRAATADGRSDIWVMNEDGTGQVNLTGDLPAQGMRSGPAWSWDGTRIAFAQMENGIAGSTSSIWTMRADGSDKQRVTSTLSGFDAMPTWSPDGATLAFRRYYGSDADIAVVSLATGAQRRIALPGNQSSPAWSPDGAQLAFTQNLGLAANVYTMRPDGSRVRLRTVNLAWGGGLNPAWVRRY